MGAIITAIVSAIVWVGLEMLQQGALPARLRFSMRSLMVFMTVFAMTVGLGAAVYRLQD